MHDGLITSIPPEIFLIASPSKDGIVQAARSVVYAFSAPSCQESVHMGSRRGAKDKDDRHSVLDYASRAILDTYQPEPPLPIAARTRSGDDRTTPRNVNEPLAGLRRPQSRRSVTVEIEGQGATLLKAGEVGIVPAEFVHLARNESASTLLGFASLIYAH
jgi:hypothetical protein